MNNKIDPILYNFYLRLNDTLGAKIVHRRRRKSSTCIEVVFYNDLCKFLHGRLNTLKEAEACGYWVVCRRQTKRGRSTWRNRTVYQLYLTPVHPKKRHEAKRLAEANQVTFEPVMPKTFTNSIHRAPLFSKSADFTIFGRCLGSANSPKILSHPAVHSEQVLFSPIGLCPSLYPNTETLLCKPKSSYILL